MKKLVKILSFIILVSIYAVSLYGTMAVSSISLQYLLGVYGVHSNVAIMLAFILFVGGAIVLLGLYFGKKLDQLKGLVFRYIDEY